MPPSMTVEQVMSLKGKTTGQLASLQGKLAQAEKDNKAYKARLRQQDAQLAKVRELSAREAELERQLVAAEGASATHSREVEELRRRAVRAEASCDELREEMEQLVAATKGGRVNEVDLLQRIADLDRQVQSLVLQREKMERKAEICEAELVDTLAKVYTLDSERARGGFGAGDGGSGLSEREAAQLDYCMAIARDVSTKSDAGGWTAAAWLDRCGLGEVVAAALLRRLRSDSQPRAWAERAFMSALGNKGGRDLVRALLLDGKLIDALTDVIWRGVDAITDEDVSIARQEEALALADTVSYAGDGHEGGGGGGSGTDFGKIALAATMAEPPQHSIRLDGEPTYLERSHGGQVEPTPSSASREARAYGAESGSSQRPAPKAAPTPGHCSLVSVRGSDACRVANAPLAPLRNLEVRDTGMVQSSAGSDGFVGLQRAPQELQQEARGRSQHPMAVAPVEVAQASALRRQVEMQPAGTAYVPQQRVPESLTSPGIDHSPVQLAKRHSSRRSDEGYDSGDDYGYGDDY